jgi:hypothetical protein
VQLVAAEAQSRDGGGRNMGTSAIVVKLPKFDRSMSWTVFHQQFEDMANHNSWRAPEKATNLLTILHGQAANILHSVPARAAYDNTVGVLNHY